MQNSRLKPRRSAILAAVVVSLGSLVGCGAGPVGQTAAATVDGHEISTGEITEYLEAQIRYLESQRGKDGIDPAALEDALVSVSGAGEGTFSMGEASAALEQWINYRIALVNIEAQGGSITDADREAARAQLISQMGGSETALDDVDPVLVDFAIDSSAATSALQRLVPVITDEERNARLQELFEEVAPQRPLCLSIIVSDTEADSLAALARVDAGEDFATVATEVSTDATTAEAGGFSGCASVERAGEFFGGDFSTAATGDVTGPIVQDQLFVLVNIDSTTGPSFEQLVGELERQLQSEESNNAQEFLFNLRLGVDVTVDPRFGTWNPETGSLTPPAS